MSFKLRIIFEDKDLICVWKPAGWLSVPSRDRNDDRKIVGLCLQSQHRTQLFPIHRLDFEVSGLLLFAKNSKAQTQWQTEFEEKRVIKTYWGLSSFPQEKVIPEKFSSIYQNIIPKISDSASVKPISFQWKCLLEKGKRRAFESPRGKSSDTKASFYGKVTELNKDHISRLQSYFPTWLQTDLAQIYFWELNPITGRSHQLRYEMFRHGCPLLGDTLYSSEVKQENSIALAHIKIEFPKKGLQIYPELHE